MCDIAGVTIGKCKSADSEKEGGFTLEIVYDHCSAGGGSGHSSPSFSQGGDQHAVLANQI